MLPCKGRLGGEDSILGVRPISCCLMCWPCDFLTYRKFNCIHFGCRVAMFMFSLKRNKSKGKQQFKEKVIFCYFLLQEQNIGYRDLGCDFCRNYKWPRGAVRMMQWAKVRIVLWPILTTCFPSPCSMRWEQNEKTESPELFFDLPAHLPVLCTLTPTHNK